MKGRICLYSGLRGFLPNMEVTRSTEVEDTAEADLTTVTMTKVIRIGAPIRHRKGIHIWNRGMS